MGQCVKRNLDIVRIYESRALPLPETTPLLGPLHTTFRKNMLERLDPWLSSFSGSDFAGAKRSRTNLKARNVEVINGPLHFWRGIILDAPLVSISTLSFVPLQ